jgi:hypothetical protein
VSREKGKEGGIGLYAGVAPALLSSDHRWPQIEQESTENMSDTDNTEKDIGTLLSDTQDTTDTTDFTDSADSTDNTDSTGLDYWGGASSALCSWLHMHGTPLVQGRVVVEMGAGLGLVGIATARMNKPAKVHLTDYHPLVLSMLSAVCCLLSAACCPLSAEISAACWLLPSSRSMHLTDNHPILLALSRYWQLGMSLAQSHAICMCVGVGTSP